MHFEAAKRLIENHAFLSMKYISGVMDILLQIINDQMKNLSIRR